MGRIALRVDNKPTVPGTFKNQVKMNVDHPAAVDANQWTAGCQQYATRTARVTQAARRRLPPKPCVPSS